MIGYKGIENVRLALRGELAAPGALAAVAAAVSIVVKEWMYHYTVRVARRYKSPALKADAWHHRSDALSSVGALVGIVGAIFGLPILDPIASLVICLFIVKVGIDIFRESTAQLTDRAADQETRDMLVELMGGVPGVIGIDDLKTRVHGSGLYIDVEIAVDPALTVREGHDIALALHNLVETRVDRVNHVNVHVNPAV
jgi:cation diffusion facilitator family transporter